MRHDDPAGIVRAYWAAMNGNDFHAVAQHYLAENIRIF